MSHVTPIAKFGIDFIKKVIVSKEDIMFYI